MPTLTVQERNVSVSSDEVPTTPNNTSATTTIAGKDAESSSFASKTEAGGDQQSFPTSDPEGQVIEDVDPVFGNEAGAAIHYKTLHWWHVGVLMLAETISLGVLALPQCIAVLGLVPGLLLIFVLGIIAFYTGFVIGQFKQAFPQTQSFADCGEMIAGRVGKEVMAIGSLLILVFIMAAHILSFAIAMNAMTNHGSCSVLFAAIGLVVCFVLGLPRTLKNVSYLSIFSCISVIVAVTVAMAAIAVEKKGEGLAVAVGPNVPLVKGLGPVMNIILAYAGHVAFFGFCAELKQPKDFPKALGFMMGTAVGFYVLISAVIYYYAGPLVTSPALGSAPPLVMKIAFGIALPTIVVAGVVNGSVACKYIYVRMWKGTNVIHENSFRGIGSWVAICAVLWVISFVIAEAIPNFNLLLGLIAALFCSWFSYGLPGFLWLYMNKGQLFKTKKKCALTILNSGILLLGAAICILGMWSSGWELSRGAAGTVFSCANNWKPSILVPGES